MTLGYRDILAVLIIVYYVPCFVASCALIYRHGWRQSWLTWFVLATFAITRIAYAALQLAAYTHPDRFGLRVAAATLAADAVSPLLFLANGLLHRLRELSLLQDAGYAASRQRVTHHRFLRHLEVVITAAFICASIGYRSMTSDDVRHGIATHSGTLKAAASLYVVSLVGIVAATAWVWAWCRDAVRGGERKVLLCLVAGLPLLCIRTVYFAVDVLGDVQSFSAISGNVTIFLCMALVVEAVLAAGGLALGWSMRVVGKEEWAEVERRRREVEQELEREKRKDAGDDEASEVEGRGREDLESGRRGDQRV